LDKLTTNGIIYLPFVLSLSKDIFQRFPKGRGPGARDPE
jgi:hypothetical protein